MYVVGGGGVGLFTRDFSLLSASDVITVAVGAAVSITNVGTASALLAFPAASVTVTVQFECVTSPSVAKVAVCTPVPTAPTAVAEQSPPKAEVPASSVLYE